jgi:hypothetical protein
MTIKNLFSIAAILDLLLGAAWLLFPEAVLAWWGTTAPDEMLVYISRRYAVLFLGFGITLWLSRNSPPSVARRALVVGGFVVTLLMAAMSLMGALAGTINAFGYMSFAIEALLAAGFAYFLFVRREPTS